MNPQKIAKNNYNFPLLVAPYVGRWTRPDFSPRCDPSNIEVFLKLNRVQLEPSGVSRGSDISESAKLPILTRTQSQNSPETFWAFCTLVQYDYGCFYMLSHYGILACGTSSNFCETFFARNWLLKLEKGSCGLKYFNLSIDLNGANGLSSKYASHPASMLSKYNWHKTVVSYSSQEVLRNWFLLAKRIDSVQVCRRAALDADLLRHVRLRTEDNRTVFK